MLTWSWSVNDVLVLITWVVLVVVVLSSLFVYVIKPSPRKQSQTGTFSDILGEPGSPRRTGASSTSFRSASQRSSNSSEAAPSSNASANYASLGGESSYSPNPASGDSKMPNEDGESEATALLTQGAANTAPRRPSQPQAGDQVLTSRSAQRNSVTDRALADTLKAVLQHGMITTMHTLENGPKQISLSLANNSSELHWKGTKMFSRKSYRLSLYDVVCVEVGKKTNVFLNKLNTHSASVSEDLCLSVVTKTHTLDLETATKVERDVFADGLNNIINDLRTQRLYQV